MIKKVKVAKPIPSTKEKETVTNNALQTLQSSDDIRETFQVGFSGEEMLDNGQVVCSRLKSPVIINGSIGSTSTINSIIARDFIDIKADESAALHDKSAAKEFVNAYITNKRNTFDLLITSEINNYVSSRIYDTRRLLLDYISTNFNMLFIDDQEAQENIIAVLNDSFFPDSAYAIDGRLRRQPGNHPKPLQYPAYDAARTASYAHDLPRALDDNDSDATASISLNMYTGCIIPSIIIDEYDFESKIIMPLIYRYSNNPDRAYCNMLDNIVTFNLLKLKMEIDMYATDFLGKASIYAQESYPEINLNTKGRRYDPYY